MASWSVYGNDMMLEKKTLVTSKESVRFGVAVAPMRSAFGKLASS